MADLRISVALSSNAWTEPVFAGRVKPEGLEWSCSRVHPSEMFWRQLKFADFDVSEMSLSSLLISASHGKRDWVAFPVFTTRRFFHSTILVRSDAGIEKPEDLVGKRIGVPEYQQTAAVWARGALQHEWGVTADRLTWFMERSPERSHGGSTDFKPPGGVSLEYIPLSSSIQDMLEAGELDASLRYIPEKNLVDRSRRPAASLRGVRTLFPDPILEGVRYYEKTGIHPVNHVMVVRESLYRESPWVVLNLYSAMLEAKRLAMEDIAKGLEPYSQIGLVPPKSSLVVGSSDPVPYGFAGNPALKVLPTYLFEQGLTDRVVAVEEVFAESTLDL